MIEEKILERGKLKVAVKNIQLMSHTDYAMARKNYFGASDSSILCGVNLYKNMDELIKEKNTKYITREELAVGEKPIVKKGYDLEPIILLKAEQELNLEVYKPKDMYAFKKVNGLSVNYDGVIETEDGLIPVEAKLISKFGEKYYNKTITIEEAKQLKTNSDSCVIDAHIKARAIRYGIPPYYYTQVQQEIAGLDAPYGYLAAMFDDSWSFKLYYIPRDDYVINSIYAICEARIKQIKRDTE